MKISRPAATRISAVLACLAVMTGCAAQRPAQPSTRPVASRHAEPAAQAAILTTVTSLRQGWDIDRAQEQLIAHCMSRRGFRYPIASQGPAPSTRTVTSTEIGAGRPATYGITLDHQNEPSAPQPARARYGRAYQGPEAARATLRLPGGMLIGYNTGGCLAQARASLFGSVHAAMENWYVPAATGQLFHAFLATDRPYQSALHIWQACMATAGWHFTDPKAALLSIISLASQPGTTARALNIRQAAVAGTDVRCDHRSRLRYRTRQQIPLWLNRQPASTVALLQQAYQAQQRAAATALRILARAG